MTPESLETIELQSGPAPSASVIVLHGLGADGSDFVPVCKELDLRTVGDVRYVLPNAPERAVTVNGGYVMRAWYDIFAFGAGHAEDEAGLRDSQARIETLIAREVERGVAAERIVLMGFSQGSAMALLTGLRHSQRLAGIVALSGYLPLAEKTAAEQHVANARTPIFMGHGRSDDIVTIARGHASHDALRALGHAVDWHEYDMPHSVCMDEIADFQQWLLGVLT
jgi:phospholipase/carboxylesterase